MLRRSAPYLIAALVSAISVFGLATGWPATGAPDGHADYVIIAGAAGLRWDDVNPTDTPTLWRLAEHGSMGALSVGSARIPTCPADGWLTLGAGNFAQRTAGDPRQGCGPMQVRIQTPDAIGAYLPDQETDVAALNRVLSYGAQPGALAESVRCTAAVGPGGAIAAARPYGRVDRYQPVLPEHPETLLSGCVLSIVDLGTIAGDVPAVRQAAARQADRVLARVLGARPSRSLVLVAGLADTDLTSRLHVAIADGSGYPAGWLTSSSTSRPGYLQLTDLAPTALNALGRPMPEKLFAGQPAGSATGRPADLATAVSRLSDADREAGAQRRVTGWFLTFLAMLELALFVVVVPALRRARRYAGPTGPRPMSPRLVRALEVALVAASLTLPAALVADLVPWWRTSAAGPLFSTVTLVVAAGLTALVLSGPWRRGALGPLGAVAGIIAGIVGVDVLTGARLQLNNVVGYSALEGGRYAGLGTVGLGLLLAGILLLAGALAQRCGRRWRPAVMAAVGGVGVILVGSPYLGANAGGAVSLTAGVCVAAAICTGGFLTFARLAWAMLAGLAVTAGFALLDLLRPPGDQGSLGRVLIAAREGTGATAIHHTGAANAAALVNSPLTLVALGSGVLLLFVLLRPGGGLKRLFGLYPAVRAALVGTAVAGLLAGFLDGAALMAAGAAAAIAMPLACLGALRVLDHADDRTPARALPPVPTRGGRNADNRDGRVGNGPGPDLPPSSPTAGDRCPPLPGSRAPAEPDTAMSPPVRPPAAGAGDVLA
jgi:hypothetical protein